MGDGLYLHQANNGLIVSDSVVADNQKQLSGVRFMTGDVVTVSLQPETGILTYSCRGKSFEQRTAIGPTTTEPVHFCVHLGMGCDVSIIQ